MLWILFKKAEVLEFLKQHPHPNIVRYLVELFHGTKTNQKNAQLVFTTHDTSLLDSDLFIFKSDNNNL